MEEKHVVTNFLELDNKILILKRSDKVGTYKERWAGVSGYVETDPDKQALVEIKEETGLKEEDIKLIKKGRPLEVIDEVLKIKWIVHPYRWRIENPKKIKIDWEHKEIRWINPQDLSKYLTVPKLEDAWKRVK